MKTREDVKMSFYTFPRDICEEFSCAKAKALREQYADTSNDIAVILNAYFI